MRARGSCLAVLFQEGLTSRLHPTQVYRGRESERGKSRYRTEHQQLELAGWHVFDTVRLADLCRALIQYLQGFRTAIGTNVRSSSRLRSTKDDKKGGESSVTAHLLSITPSPLSALSFPLSSPSPLALLGSPYHDALPHPHPVSCPSHSRRSHREACPLRLLRWSLLYLQPGEQGRPEL